MVVAVAAGTVKSVSDGGCCCNRDSKVCVWWWLLLQLKQLGHSVDKVEFIVMGGTFMSLPDDYRDYFIRSLHDALSGHTSCNVEEAVK